MTATLTTPTTFSQLAETEVPPDHGEIVQAAIALLVRDSTLNARVENLRREPTGICRIEGHDVVFRFDLRVRDARRRYVSHRLGSYLMDVQMLTTMAVHITRANEVRRNPVSSADFDHTSLDITLIGEPRPRRIALTGNPTDYPPLRPDLCQLKDRFILQAAFGRLAESGADRKRRKRRPVGR